MGLVRHSPRRSVWHPDVYEPVRCTLRALDCNVVVVNNVLVELVVEVGMFSTVPEVFEEGVPMIRYNKYRTKESGVDLSYTSGRACPECEPPSEPRLLLDR